LAGETGSATVCAAGAILVLLTVTVIAVELAAGVIARHRAEAAADLGALAAAEHVLDGQVAACGYAERVAERMAVRLLACRLDDDDALVETAGRVALGVPFGTGVRARARAGPAPWPRCPTSGCPGAAERRERTG
jgi:secretion/DNA translocation related TadE-like protein